LPGYLGITPSALNKMAKSSGRAEARPYQKAAPSHFASILPIKSRIPRVGFIFPVSPTGLAIPRVTGAERKPNRFGTVKAIHSTAIMAGIALAMNQTLERVVVFDYALVCC
jgi:hypothetical protein